MSYDVRSRNQSPPFSFFWPIVMLIVLGVVAVWRFWPAATGPVMDPNAEPRAVAARGTLAEDEKTTIAIFKEASPSVVNITRVSERRDPFNLNVESIPEGAGSGFIWDKDGHVVTNYHVVQGEGEARVTLADQSVWKAKLVGAYPDKDLAVLWIAAPKEKLRPIPVGTSNDLLVGQKTFAIGNPFGLDQTLTTGIVSALGREIQSSTRRTIKNVIQTSAPINPGNSGGPLLDSAGRLIGVNAAILSPSGTFAGIGFAIPVDEVNRAVPQLIRHGKIVRPGLGVQIATDQVAKKLRLKGVLILKVQPGSSAEKVGMRSTKYDEDDNLLLGDVIVAIDQQPIATFEDLASTMERYRVGDKVTVRALRDGQEQKFEVPLQAVQ